MLNEPRPFASLGSTLLARKGGAKPAMRPQLSPLLAGPIDADADSDLDDLGWNDMGAPETGEAEIVSITRSLTPYERTPADDFEDSEDFEDEAHSAADLHDEDHPGPFDTAPLAPFAHDAAPTEDAAHETAALEPPAFEHAAPEPPAFPEPAPRFEPVDGTPLVRRQQKTLARTFATEPRPARRKAAEEGRRAAFTLRLDAERHLKLRLASTIRNRSAQQLVTEALDRYLAEIPEIHSLAAQVVRN